MGGTVVVVGATVVVVGVVVAAAVDFAVLPAHPLTSTTSTTVMARRAVERLVLAGMRRPPPALQRGEGRVPGATWCDRRAGVEPVRGDGAAASATSSDDAPCPTGWGSGSLASRSAVLAWNATPCLAVEKEANVELVPAPPGTGQPLTTQPGQLEPTGRVRRSHPTAAAGLGSCQRGKWSLRTGRTCGRAGDHRCQARARFVLAAVPSSCP